MTYQIQFPYSTIADLKRRFTKKKKPWITLARHRRKNDVVRLRSRLSHSPETERLFWTDAYLPNDSRLSEEDRAKHPVSIWSDIVFPSRMYNDVLYNCEVLNFDAELIDYARERSFEEIPSPWQEGIETRVAMRDKWGRPTLYEIVRREGEDEWFKQLRARQKEILTGGMELRERIIFDYDYRYGIGLYLVLNIPNFDLAGLKLAMERFFDGGEKEWLGEPVFHNISEYWLSHW
jgi:hypothetical protein